jgi:hypothetical protein
MTPFHIYMRPITLLIQKFKEMNLENFVFDTI